MDEVMDKMTMIQRKKKKCHKEKIRTKTKQKYLIFSAGKR